MGGMALMKEDGAKNNNYKSFKGTSHILAPFIKSAKSLASTKMHNWFYISCIVRGWSSGSISGMSSRLDKILAANRNKPREEVNQLILNAICQAHPLCSTKELAHYAQNLGENERAIADELVSCFRYYGSHGLDRDCQVLVSEWDVDWDLLWKLNDEGTQRWGIAHGRADAKVPCLHGQWWEAKLPKTESCFLEGYGHMSMLSTNEMYDLMSRVYRGQSTWWPF